MGHRAPPVRRAQHVEPVGHVLASAESVRGETGAHGVSADELMHALGEQ
jgi:hypothetical protein